MSVMMRNGVQYAGEPTDRLDNIEEIIGDGQQSVGSDLTDAVTQLNSSLANLSNVAIKNFLNAPTINIDIGEAPTSTKVALAFLYNANQGTMCLIKLETTPVITPTFGTKTYTITRNGSVFTVTPNGTLWGITTVIISKNF